VHKDGGLSVDAAGGRRYQLRADGTLSSYSGRGHTATFRPDGRISTLRAGGMQIDRGLQGDRRIVTTRPDGSLLVGTGSRRGYLQRTFVRNNTAFIQRTYVVNQVTYTRVYSTYTYGGIVLERYHPPVYYAPGFYGWVYYPWARPVAYTWGWAGEPWYGFHHAYFTPLPVYASASLWLADFLLAESLREAYLSRSENFAAPATAPSAEAAASAIPEGGPGAPAAGPAQGETPITPEIREAIAQEVQRQLAQQHADAANPEQANQGELPAVLRDPQHVFVVSSSLDVTVGDEECGLTPGDVLRLNGVPPDGTVVADVRVVSSKRSDCAAGSVVTVSVNDLQEMHNNFQEKIDTGLGTLRASQGSGGLPAAPADAVEPPPRPSLAADHSSPEPNVQAMLQEQEGKADQAETSIVDALTRSHS
jgi:hypothetical protein